MDNQASYETSVSLHYQDPLNCLQALFQSPLTADYINLTPL